MIENDGPTQLIQADSDLEGVSADEIAAIKQIGTEHDAITLPDNLIVESESQEKSAEASNKELMSEGDADAQDVRLLISKMTIPQKIKLAMFGNGVCRGILIRDSNKMISSFVLKNPRLNQREIEDYAKNAYLGDHILRAIADNSAWMRTYSVRVNLVSNPKTPGDISLKWLRHLNLPELRRLAKSKSVPQIVSVNARKRVNDHDSSKGRG